MVLLILSFFFVILYLHLQFVNYEKNKRPAQGHLND